MSFGLGSKAYSNRFTNIFLVISLSVPSYLGCWIMVMTKVFLCSCRYTMGVTFSDPPPQGSSSSQDKKTGSLARFSYPEGKHVAMNCQLSLKQLISSSEGDVKIHNVFTEHGRERVCVSCFTIQYRWKIGT